MEFFEKNKILIFRSVGVLMLLVGFVVHFWVTPKEVLTKNDIAALNVARMEARTSGGSSSGSNRAKTDTSEYLQELKNAQAKQMQYLTIIAMTFGIAFLGYSFVGKKKQE
nr:hypothetical protein [uncultured Sulfurimonas sp.]